MQRVQATRSMPISVPLRVPQQRWQGATYASEEPAYARPQYGYWRRTVLQQRERWPVNRKRIYGEEYLQVRTMHRTKRAARRRKPLPSTEPREHRTIAFVSDQPADVHRFRLVTAIDQVGRECVELEAAQQGYLQMQSLGCLTDRRRAMHGRW